jgi:rhamnogalacturonan endolyase
MFLYIALFRASCLCLLRPGYIPPIWARQRTTHYAKIEPDFNAVFPRCGGQGTIIPVRGSVVFWGVKSMWRKATSFVFCLAIGSQAVINGVEALSPEASPVTITQDKQDFILDNGIVRARVRRANGDLVSLRYQGEELLYVPGLDGQRGGGHPWGYWEQTPDRDSCNIPLITIDPSENGGQRGEVSIKGYYDGYDLGTSAPGGGATCDIEIRYTLAQGESGVYTTAIYTHTADHPSGRVGESRWGVKLNPTVFDWLSVDWNRHKKMLSAADWAKGSQLNAKEIRRLNTGIYQGETEHKYDYSAVQYDVPAFGWSSTTHQVGFWMINPTIEYLSGGPTKVELTCHRDLNDVAAPTVLDYWHGGHYGGGNVTLRKGEAWTKVVGPILNYCNAGGDPDAMFTDALHRAELEAKAWPYAWLDGVDYPHKEARGAVAGKLTVRDDQATQPVGKMIVGLSQPDIAVTGGGGGGRRGGAGPQVISWQNDAKNYQFWATAADNGAFSIPNVRPGKYTLHALADGVLGEFAKTEIEVKAGEKLALGNIVWQPKRFGKQLWDIGIPNRSAKEFLHGNDYWHWGLYLKYAQDFPLDVRYVIGKSDFRKDWNYAHVPHWDGVEKETNDGTSYRGEAATWTIEFAMPSEGAGKATLRLAVCGGGAPVTVAVNGEQIGGPVRTMFTRSVGWDGIQGVWNEFDVSFAGSLLQAGANEMTLTVPAGSVTSGNEYDYLRLELDETAKAP